MQGKFAYDFINHPDRLKTPLIRKNGKLVEATWDEALDLIASKVAEIKDKYGPMHLQVHQVPAVTNEENYLFQKFVRTVLEL